MLKMLGAVVLVVSLPSVAFGEATRPGAYYVLDDALEVRLSPGTSGSVTNRIYRRQKVDVFEVKDDWARVSRFYDGAVEGKSGRVARWVLAKGLSSSQPPELPQPSLPDDGRIAPNAIPKAGEGGLTEQDVRTLYKGAQKILDEGRCARVEYGDKSVSKPNTFYINCGGANIFFKSSDLR